MGLTERFRKMNPGRRMDREKWLKGIKLTAAAILAITAANLFGLKFAATAGIITILSIQNTKKETLRVACRRGLAFLCALGIAAAAFGALGFTMSAFALYLLVFSCVCLFFGWTEAIAMDSVLITHFLTEGNMEAALFFNEVCLFLIGTGMGILANLHLHKQIELYDRLAQNADRLMRAALKELEKLLTLERTESGREPAEAKGAQGLTTDRAFADAQGLTDVRKLTDAAQGAFSEQDAKVQRCLDELDRALAALRSCAFRNRDNTFFGASVHESEYAMMRSRQAEVLRRIHASVNMTESVPKQTAQVAALIGRIEAEYERNNTVAALQDALRGLFEEMRRDALPKTREEFEARAVLFYLLKQLEEFLQLKRDFVESHAVPAP